jgi:hypothetical protein
MLNNRMVVGIRDKKGIEYSGIVENNCYGRPDIGSLVTIRQYNSNGLLINITGRIVEVLEDEDYGYDN